MRDDAGFSLLETLVAMLILVFGLPEQVIVTPGEDQILGTADDVEMRLSNFTREIEIRDIQNSPTLRQVRVIMRYQVGNQARTYTLTTFVSSFS